MSSELGCVARKRVVAGLFYLAEHELDGEGTMTDLGQHFDTAKLLRYTLPVMGMLLLSSAYGIVDGLFVSNFAGKTAFASVTITMPFVMILSTVGMMMGSGGSALVGRLLGAGREHEANGVFSLITWTTLAVGVVAAVLGVAFMDPVVRLLGADEAMMPPASAYGRIAFLSMPMFMLQYTLEVFSATSGKPQLGLYSAAVAGVVNIGLDALFLAVFGWGVVGAATATAIAEYASAGLLIALFFRGKAGSLRLGRPSGGWRVLAGAAYNGVSEMVGSMAASVVAVAYNLQLMAYFGEVGVAAYGVIEYISMLFGAMLGGYVEGSAPLMSYQHGARNDAEKRSLFAHGVAIVSAGGLGMLVLSQLLAYPLAYVFTGYDAELLALTERAFRIYSVAFAFMGFTMLGSSVFTALGNGTVSAVIAFVHTGLFEIGSVLLLPPLLGPESIWWAITVAEVAATALTAALLAAYGPRYGLLASKGMLGKEEAS